MIDLAFGMPFGADLALLTNQRRHAGKSPYRVGSQMSIMLLEEHRRVVVPIGALEMGGRRAAQSHEGAGCR
jgi:hypothetical protein